jgi:hypothetical protein
MRSDRRPSGDGGHRGAAAATLAGDARGAVLAAEMQRWIAEGTIDYREGVADGTVSAFETFIVMRRADNFGKRVIRVGDGEVQ